MNNRRNQLMLASAIEYCKCVVEGKTIKYNQLVQNGNFVNTNNWVAQYGTFSVSNNIGTLTCNGVNPNARLEQNVTLIANHKYLICSNMRCNNTRNGVCDVGGASSTGFTLNANQWNFIAKIVTTNANYNSIMLQLTNAQSGDILDYQNYMFIDLTELGLDNINSVADFYATDLGKYIKKGNYLETTSGAFIQAKTPIIFKGVNIWNEQTTLISNHLESENIKCLPNKNYYFSCSREEFAVIGTIYWYDKNGTQLDYNDFYERNIVSPSNSAYFKLVFNSTYGTTYNHDICIGENAWDENWELVNSKLTSKSPIKVFEGATYFITAPLLWGIFESDASGNMGNGIETYSVSGGYRFKIPKNCHYIMFNMASSYGSTYNNDIAIFYVGYQKYCGRTGKVFAIDYNQQIKNGNFATTDDWDLSNVTLSVSDNVGNISRITGTSAKISQTIKLVATHTYAIMFKAKTSISYADSKLTLNGNNIGTFTVQGAGALWQDFGWILSNPSLNGDYALDLYLNLSGTFIGSIYDFFYIKEFNVVDLTALGMDNISTISAFNNTDLGQLIAEKGYLPYSQRNVGYALGKQLQKGDFYKTYGVDKVSYNQLVQNGDFQDTSGWTSENGTIQANVGSLTYEITTVGSDFASNRIEQTFSHTAGHKYFVIVDILCPYSTTINLYVGSWETLGTAQENTKTTLTKIYTASSTGNNNLYFDIHGQPSYSVGDKITVYKYMKIDLTALGLSDIATLEEFYRTPLGMLVKKGFYLNYTTSIKTIKPQLVRTMKEIDIGTLDWDFDEIGTYVPIPSDCKTYNSDEMPNILSVNYVTAKYLDEVPNSISIYNFYGFGWCLVVRPDSYGNYKEPAPTGKFMYELNTPIIVDEEIEDIMVSRRTIGVESDNGIDLDFTKE